MEAARGLRPRSLQGGLTPPGASGSRRSPGREWRPATRAFSKRPSISLPQPVSRYRWRPRVDSIPHPTGIFRARGSGKSSGRGRPGTGSAGHPDPALQGTPSLSSLPQGVLGPRPGPGFPQSRADPPRLLPRDAEGRPATSGPSPSPAEKAARRALASPASAYLAVDLFHHSGCWGLTGDSTTRRERGCKTQN